MIYILINPYPKTHPTFNQSGDFFIRKVNRAQVYNLVNRIEIIKGRVGSLYLHTICPIPIHVIFLLLF